MAIFDTTGIFAQLGKYFSHSVTYCNITSFHVVAYIVAFYSVSLPIAFPRACPYVSEHMSRAFYLSDPDVFSFIIRERRLDLGLSQGQLAKLTGTTTPYISMLENRARTVPSSIVLIKLAMHLNFDFIDFLISAKLIDACDNPEQINESARLIQIWEHSLDLKEAIRISHTQLESIIKRTSETSQEVRDILRIVKKNVDFIYNFCFDPRRKLLTKDYYKGNKITDV